MKRPFLSRLWGPGGARLLLGDLAVIAVLVGAMAALLAPRAAGGRPSSSAEVDVSGRAVARLDLLRDQVSEVLGPLGPTRIEVQGGRVRVLSSPCARQSCRHGGWIDSAGAVLVCLPNEVVVRLPGRRAGAPDAVTR